MLKLKCKHKYNCTKPKLGEVRNGRMKMEKFARIIELESHQVLLTKDYDDDEDKYKLSVRIDINDVACRASWTCETEEEVNKKLESFDVELAFKLYEKFKSLVV